MARVGGAGPQLIQGKDIVGSSRKLILVTGAGGGTGSVGRKVVELLIERGFPVRAQVRRLDDRSEALSKLGDVQLVVADFNSLDDTHRAVKGCSRIFFCMSVAGDYLEASLNMAAVAKHHGVEVFVNLSQMSVSSMSITASSTSKQQRYHWLVEQALKWSGLPAVQLRPTIFLEHPFFNVMAAKSILVNSGEIRLPFKRGKVSPVAADDVARVGVEVITNPEGHLGRVYNICGPVSEDMDAVAREYSKALGREVKYVDLPFEEWEQTELLKEWHFSDHLNNHFVTLATLAAQGKMDRTSDDFEHVTGVKAMTIEAWVRQNKLFDQSL
jgi:uncharacterized protein YbjT (DUF2867 family)